MSEGMYETMIMLGSYRLCPCVPPAGANIYDAELDEGSTKLCPYRDTEVPYMLLVRQILALALLLPVYPLAIA